MKRNKILDEFPLDYDKTAVEQESDLLDYISSVLDHLEDKFKEIADKLEITDICELDQVEDAWKIAKDTADELY